MHRARYLVGCLVLLGALLGALWFVRVLRDLDQREGLPLSIEFRDARGLRAGADVRYRGVNVGTVRSVAIAADGKKATAAVLLDLGASKHACVNSSFWIVTPRFAGLTGGASGLDTLVRDAYVTWETPNERGSPLVPGSLLAGREKPPPAAEPEALDDIEHGDLLMSVLVPENHGLRPGSAVIFRGQPTGDVRSVELAPDGTHVVVKLRIARKYRQTVTDRCQFWVARPAVTGALLSGFTLTDVAALLSPYVSYYGEPGKGTPVVDGYRTAAAAARPSFDASPVPGDALRQQPAANATAVPDDIVVVRIVYDAVERDTWSADDPVHGEGTGLLLLARDGHAVVVTARSVVDGSITTQDAFGSAPEIDNEQIKVMLSDGTVLRAGRVWVHPGGRDIAALLLEDPSPSLRGTPLAKLQFASDASTDAMTLRAASADGLPLAPSALDPKAADLPLGAAVTKGERVVGIVGRGTGVGAMVELSLVPADLRPQ